MEKERAKPMGRPRTFDVEKALDDAMRLFWQKGYEGTSVADLTKAMGISAPSLYAAFGNKESLFKKVFERYAAGPAFIGRCALSEPTARGAIECMLTGAARTLTDPAHPGCLSVSGALACGEESAAIKRELANRRAAGQLALRERLAQAKAEGELPPSVDVCALSRFYSTVLQGMSVQAAGGATTEDLLKVVAIALSAWPTP